jgi:cysteine desulfurase/selenocysteine lyase
MNRRKFLHMTAATPLVASAFADTLFAKPIVAQSEPNSPISMNEKISAEEKKYWDDIRAQFPISQELIYMNNGTMGPSPKVITDRVTARIVHVDRTGDYGGDHEAIKKAIARVIGAAGPDEIAFTHNVSEAISIISSGLELKSGDEVILTDQEHGGNAVPWLARAKRDGIKIKFVTLAPDDATTLDRFEKAFTPRTKAIAVPHVTCTTGQVLPVKELVRMAHNRGIRVMLDGAHPPGMMQLNVKEIGADAYTSCGHKWLCGPKGVGFLYISPETLDHVIPTWAGAESDKYWGYDGKLDFLPSASRYDFATQNFALYDGLLGAIEFMEAIGFAKIEARIQSLTMRIRKGLAEHAPSHYDMLTPPTSITGLTTIKLRDMDYHDFANTLLARHKVRTRVVPESNLNANRFSAHIYTSEEDIDSFLEGAKDVLETRKK